MRPATIALIAALGLVLVGTALGLLYIEAREWRLVEMRHERTLQRQVADTDEVVREINMPRILAALVCGSLGAGLVGFGGVMVLCRMRLFGGPQ